MNQLSIRLRLTIWYVISLSAMLAIFSFAIDALMHARLLSRTDFELDEELHELVLEVQLARDRDDLLRQLNLRFSEHKSFEFQIQYEAGSRLFASRGLQSETVPAPDAFDGDDRQFSSIALASLGDSRIASQRLTTPGGTLIVQSVMPLGRYVAELRDLRRLLLTMSPLVVLVSIGGGYWLAGRALRPVDQMTRSAERITAAQLDERLEVVNPRDELGRLAATLNCMIERLQLALNETRQFTADAAHELRTPLAVIRSTAELALHSARSADYYRECLSEIVDETERMTNLSNQLLLLAREDADVGETHLHAIRLDELMHKIAVDLEPLCDDRSLTLACQLETDLRVAGDEERLRRVFVNLLDNAIKYTPTGGRISMSLARDGRSARATVSDTGVGISPEHLPHVFDRFFRADPSRTRDTGGAGLGLAICRAIVARHGGSIEIASRAGSGTQVEIRLSCV